MQRHQTGKKDEQLTTISRPQPHSQACAASAALPSTKQSQQPSALHDAQPPLQPAVIHTPSTPVAVLAHSSSSSDLLLSIATMPSIIITVLRNTCLLYNSNSHQLSKLQRDSLSIGYAFSQQTKKSRAINISDFEKRQ